MFNGSFCRVFYDKSRRFSAMLVSSLFLFLPMSLLVAAPQRSYPDISPSDASAYILMMDIATDGAHALTPGSRTRGRAEFFLASGLTLVAVIYGLFRLSGREADISPYGGRGEPLSQRFCMVSRK
ncbi:MAG: hypothetical protein LBS93_03535 [Synergistaceae bacterium]|jgi:hypothetical protein|nr:hypothetical protein [Synergistaceae bacterium]